MQYFRGSHAVLITYDSTRRSSFENLNVWLEQIEERCPEYAVKILVATKCDLKREGMFLNSEQVPPEEGQTFADQN